jgi:glycerol-3-phosphate cytidylyltransferase
MRRGIIYGCFDLFNVGHYKILQESSRLCHYFTIGVFSDDVIKKYKGRLPAVPQEYRIALLKEMFPSDTVILVKKRKPSSHRNYDMIFVSRELFGKKLAMINDKFKGQVVYIPYTQGISSTIIRKRVLELAKDGETN